MEAIIAFSEEETLHVQSNARGMRMSVAQYLAVTLFNGAGISPSAIEVDNEPPYQSSSRWESGD